MKREKREKWAQPKLKLSRESLQLLSTQVKAAALASGEDCTVVFRNCRVTIP